MRRSLDCCRIEKLGLAKTIKKKWKKEGQEESGIGEGKNIHNAFHFNVAIRIRKSTQWQAVKITNEREGREESESQAGVLL